MDSREYKYAPIPAAFERQQIPFEVEYLDSGDYVLNDCAVERKTPDDYLQSLNSGHLFDQCTNMVRNFRRCCIVVEGNPEDIMFSNATIASVASCAVRGCPVIFCGDIETMVTFINYFLTKSNDNKDRSYKATNQRSYSDPAINILMGVPKMPEEVANRLLDTFATPSRIGTATMDELQEVKGVGEKTAKNIYEAFNTPRW